MATCIDSNIYSHIQIHVAIYSNICSHIQIYDRGARTWLHV